MQNETSVLKLNTNLIIPNKYQPRKVFDEASLNALSESIKQYGIINPILVRQKDDKYEIIAGERRFRAAIIAGLPEVPVIVKTADEQQMAELALIENIQRQGLNPIEEAKSYEEIMRIGNQTQSKLAEKIGKSQAAIANKIRLLSLPEEIQNALSKKQISERHARTLINVQDKEKQMNLLERIIKEKLTVKETEEIVNLIGNDEEIKKAISDIMKSLNIKEEEKEDDNMNGNFFPNFDNTLKGSASSSSSSCGPLLTPFNAPKNLCFETLKNLKIFCIPSGPSSSIAKNKCSGAINESFILLEIFSDVSNAFSASVEKRIAVLFVLTGIFANSSFNKSINFSTSTLILLNN